MATVALELPRKTSTLVREDHTWVRRGLTLLALLSLGLFIVLPLAAVFVQAFAKGWAAYAHAVTEPNTLCDLSVAAHGWDRSSPQFVLRTRGGVVHHKISV